MSLNQQVKEIPKWNITLISCAPSTGAVTKKLPVRTEVSIGTIS